MAAVSSLFSIGEAVDEILREGPLTEDELLDALDERGLDLGDEPIALVYDAMSEDIELIGGLFVNMFWVVEYLSCAVDVPPDAGDRLVCAGALRLFTAARFEGFDLEGTDDGWVSLVDADDGNDVDVLVGPPGWLAPVLGRRAVLTLDHGSLSIEPDERASAGDEAIAAAFRAALEAHLADRRGHDVLREQFEDEDLRAELGNAVLDAVLMRLAVDANGLLRSRIIPPIAVLAADAGLEVRGASVAPIGTDWDLVERNQRLRRYVMMHGLDRLQADWLNLALGAAGTCLADGVIAVDEAERPGAAALVAALLHDADVGRAFLSEWADNGYDERDLLTFVNTVMEDIGDHDPSGVVYLAASTFDALGMVPEALAALDRIVPHTDHVGLLVMRAGYAADAGDVRAAAEFLRRAGTSPDTDEEDATSFLDQRAAELWQEISVFASRPPAVARRNDPCPCGSGRKYKACHQGSEQHPLERRAAWLHRKALRYADDHARAEHLDHVSSAAAASGGGYRIMQALRGGELIGDVTLHEGGVWSDFLAARGPLLPEDEQLLAAQWALVDRSVFEVVSTRPDEMRLRDLRTGDVITVSEVTTDGLRPGILLVGRPLPVGDTHRAIAGLALLGGRLRDHAIQVLDDGDPDEVANLIGTTMQPPQLSNTDGHQMRFHTISWLVEDERAAVDALRRAGWNVRGREVTLVRNSMNQRDTVIASGSLADRRLTLEVNSAERAEEMRTTMNALVPDSMVVHFDIREMHEVMEAQRSTPPSSGRAGTSALTPEQERGIVAEYMAMAERSWIDEPIPALRGMTPRDAMADPIGRFELERLLDSFPDTDDPTVMSARRIRQLLGI